MFKAPCGETQQEAHFTPQTPQGWLGSVKTLAEHYDPSSHHVEDNPAIPIPLLATLEEEELSSNGVLQQPLLDVQEGDVEKPVLAPAPTVP